MSSCVLYVVHACVCEIRFIHSPSVPKNRRKRHVVSTRVREQSTIFTWELVQK